MMQSLGIGVSGLTAAQRGIDVVSHNIANVNTPGYTRQRVDQSAAYPTMGERPFGPGAYGTGVEVTQVRQLRDTLLDNGVRSALAGQGSREEVSRAMSSIQSIAGSLEDGMSTDLSRLWSAWNDVAANPQGITARSTVIDAGTRLAATIRNASNSIETLATNSGARLGEYAAQATSLAQQVAGLNAKILDVTSAGGTPNDFLDQRNLALEQLSKLTDAQVRTNGAMVDVTIGGSLVVSGFDAQALTVSGDPPQILNGDTAITAGGSLGALQGLATNALDDLRQRLDLLANGLRDAVNTAHAAGTDLDGAPGAEFFTGSGAADFAVNADLGPRGLAASAGGEPSDGNNAVAMGDVRYATVIGTLNDPGNATVTAGDAIADLVSDLGRRASSAQRELDATSATVSSLDAQRQDTSGVSIDEEMTTLLSYQRAYQAAARIITTSDEMLDTLINHVGTSGR
jgi:flagellar hook-associated protein 1